MGGGKKGRKGGSSSLSQAAAKGKIDADLKEDATEKKDNEKRERESTGTPIRNKNLCMHPPGAKMDAKMNAISPGEDDDGNDFAGKELFNILKEDPVIDVVKKNQTRFAL